VIYLTRTVLVTGSGRGLGSYIVKALSEKGFNVIINYNNSKEESEKLKQEIGAQAIAIQADITDREAVEQLVKKGTEHFGQIDVVVNNALVNFKFDPTTQKAFKDLTYKDYEQQLDGTLKAAFNVSQSVIPQFLERKDGAIISIGTNLYQNPVVPYHEYTTAKAALIGFTRNVAAELGQYGIRANVVSGGLLKTTDASAVTTPEVFDLIAQSTPLRKVTTPQDVANMVVYLCSEAADGVTGQNITVDGGLTMN
jgi:3-oxoacyl-[acyl-carrier protein] reductase